MLEVQIPRNKVISKVTRRFLTGGLFHGSYGLDIRLEPYSAGADFGKDFGAVLLALLRTPLHPSLPIVRITGPDAASWPAEVLGPFIDALARYGRQVQIILDDGSVWPSWLTQDRRIWIIVRTGNPVVIVPASEVWYAPEERIVEKDGEPCTDLEDVTLLPDLSSMKTYMYLDVTRLRIPEDVVAEFVLKSAHTWAML